MRLWHKDLISVLPRQQLLGQWRECCCIAKNIAEHGTPNHLLVNKIMEYPMTHLLKYTFYVTHELDQRGYHVDQAKFIRWYDQIPDNKGNLPPYEDLFSDWHNDRYFIQCYFNLQEKYDCGGISAEEFYLIDQLWINKMQTVKMDIERM